MKTPYKNGTTHVIFEPLDFIARLSARVPKPRFHLTRFHGVFAPKSKQRAKVTSEEKEKQSQRSAETKSLSEACDRRGKKNWAMRLKRVFNIEITVCRHCLRTLEVIATNFCEVLSSLNWPASISSLILVCG